ncbi:MAG: esterase, partial [Chloroflexi bacterium]|nr:esterase [Chloroflexota bacterium]
MADSRIEYLTLESALLQHNRLGDPAVRELAVYLPPGYDETTAQRYPTLYMLSSHGRTSHYYLGWQQWDENMPQRLDRLIHNSKMPPVIVVMPDFWTRLGGSQFLDSAIGNYASHLTQEVVPAVDARFRTLANR